MFFWKQPDIEVLKTKKRVSRLAGLLSHKDDSIRNAAAAALGELRDRKAVAPLIAALSYPRTFRSVAAALVAINDPAAVPALIGIIGHNVSWERDEVVPFLAAFGPQVVIPLSVAANFLNCPKPYEGLKQRVKTAVEVLASIRDPQAADSFRALLSHPNRDIRFEAARFFEDVPGPDTDLLLMKAFRCRYDSGVALILGRVGNVDAIPILIKLWESEMSRDERSNLEYSLKSLISKRADAFSSGQLKRLEALHNKTYVETDSTFDTRDDTNHTSTYEFVYGIDIRQLARAELERRRKS